MRASGWGGGASWLAFTAAIAFDLGPFATGGALILALALTLLFVSHIVAYMIRTAASVRRCSCGKTHDHDIGRREFLGTVLRAGATAFGLAIFGTSFARLQVNCPASLAGTAVTGTGAGEGAAITDYIAKARAACENGCAARNCGAPKCLRASDNNDKQYTVPKCAADPTNPAVTICTGALKVCDCKCFTCGPGLDPPDGMVTGSGTTQEAARAAGQAAADAKCATFCEKITTCAMPTPVCKRNANAIVNLKCKRGHGNNWTCSGKIKCNCHCQAA